MSCPYTNKFVAHPGWMGCRDLCPDQGRKLRVYFNRFFGHNGLSVMTSFFPTRLLRALTALGLSLAVAVSFAETAKDSKKSGKKGFSSVPKPSDGGTNAAPPQTAAEVAMDKSIFQEIIHLLQERYADPSILSPSKLNQAAINGMLDSLQGSARLIEPEAAASRGRGTASPMDAVNSVSVINPFIGYLRVRRVEEGTGKQVEEEVRRLVQKEHINSLILDLRFADGGNFSEVPAAAAVFFSDVRALFIIQRGGGPQTYATQTPLFSTDKPLAVLVNRETRGAAETLAVALQSQERALLVGQSPTAGQAFETSDAKLSDGKILRFASGKIMLSHGGDFFLKSARADIDVDFDSKTEKEIYDQPFQPPEFRVETRLFSEAILTGRETAPPIPSANREKQKKDSKEPASNRDMVLQRAIDFLKAITTLQLRG